MKERSNSKHRILPPKEKHSGRGSSGSPCQTLLPKPTPTSINNTTRETNPQGRIQLGGHAFAMAANGEAAARVREATAQAIQSAMQGVRPDVPYVLDDLVGRGSFGAVFRA